MIFVSVCIIEQNIAQMVQADRKNKKNLWNQTRSNFLLISAR
jgi:hypothetical protein